MNGFTLKIISFFLIIALLNSCSSREKEKDFRKDLSSNDCESALKKNIPSKSTEIIGQTVKGTGTIASYLVTGIGYTSDFLILFGGGIGIGVVVCSPIVAIEAAAKSSGRASAECIGRISSTFLGSDFEGAIGLGKTAYKNTESWRCPNLDFLSEGFREVAACHHRKGNQGKAIEQIKVLKQNSKLIKCLSSEERNNINRDLHKYEKV